MFRVGFIQNLPADAVWFLALPFVAIAAALACQEYLTVVALASVGLWITVPHHFATWLRTFGLSEDWQRWKTQLIVGPVVIAGMSLLGLAYAPFTLLVVVLLWDAQHSLMQQHGFARIYDMKARAGAPSTARFDLLLAWVLFGNLFITSPMFAKIWLQELYRFNLPLTVEGVRTFQTASWTLTGVVLTAYAAHAVWCVFEGYALNPVKYLFIAASYFLWYFTAWHTNSILVFGVAHRLMHGLQYMVIVYWYLQRKRAKLDIEHAGRERWLLPGNVMTFAAMCLVYALCYQLITQQPLDDFGFGVAHLMAVYQGAPKFGLEGLTSHAGYELFAVLVIQLAALIHYYYDSFIWKVSDVKTQQGL